ncbi:MAG TPA: hypothetical protein VHQ66_12970 [Myxococcota bacterium]|nr:hypothetical protein [Myxococcota bacterium]
MEKCNGCGNEYDKPFEVMLDGRRYIFDSFECAVHTLAPRCTVCEVTILGHGVEQEGAIFCCASCARKAGADRLRDNA